MAAVLRVLAGSTLAFGGEDPLAGRPWYHRQITRRAALDAGWSPAAADDAAWHALAVDAYLYNPLWRLRLDRSRRAALRALRPSLLALHFDDLPDAAAVARMWARYTAGCVAAVLWCAGRADIAGARHAVGLTLHALQDFYSHSNWVDDPGRRTRTWWEVPAAERDRARLATGSYGLPPAPGGQRHGEIALSLPWARAVPAGPPTALGSRLLGRFVDLRPLGMSLDSRWQARAGAGVRGLADVGGAELFEHAVELAGRTSTQWLSMMDAALTGLGPPLDRFWADVRQVPRPATTRARAFDDLTGQAGRLLAAGTYPPGRGDAATAGWFLWVGALPGGSCPPMRPLLLGPYEALPERLGLTVPGRMRTAPVEVFAFRTDWPARAGTVHSGLTAAENRSGAAGRGHRELRLDQSGLVRVDPPATAG